MLVKSEYVNPDKFIQKLKDKLNRLEIKVSKSEGSHISFLECHQTRDEWGNCFDGLVPGDEVIAVCNVDKVTLYTENHRRAGSIDLTATQLRKR